MSFYRLKLMQKIIFYILILTLNLSLNAQHFDFRPDIKGSVKQITQITVSFDSLIPDTSHIISNFSKNGNLVDIRIKDKSLTHIQYYKSQNKLDSTMSFKNDQVIFQEWFYYNKNSLEKIINVVSPNSNPDTTTTEYKYNESGNLIEKNTLPFDYRIKYVYDSTNLLIGELWFKDGELYESWVFKYDSLQRITDQISLSLDDSETTHYRYIYNHMGDEMHIDELDSYNNIIIREYYEYTYDERGNWIRRHDRIDGKLKRSYFRKILYY